MALQDRLGAGMEAHVLPYENRRDEVIEDLAARARGREAVEPLPHKADLGPAASITACERSAWPR